MNLNEIIAQITPEEESAIKAMEDRGGSFVKNLAKCLRSADATNYRKLRTIFNQYFIAYGFPEYQIAIVSVAVRSKGKAFNLNDSEIHDGAMERLNEGEYTVEITDGKEFK